VVLAIISMLNCRWMGLDWDDAQHYPRRLVLLVYDKLLVDVG
jgi:hypothetical protein